MDGESKMIEEKGRLNFSETLKKIFASEMDTIHVRH